MRLTPHAGLAQLVAHHSCKVGVTGSSPVAGPTNPCTRTDAGVFCSTRQCRRFGGPALVSARAEAHAGAGWLWALKEQNQPDVAADQLPRSAQGQICDGCRSSATRHGRREAQPRGISRGHGISRRYGTPKGYIASNGGNVSTNSHNFAHAPRLGGPGVGSVSGRRTLGAGAGAGAGAGDRAALRSAR